MRKVLLYYWQKAWRLLPLMVITWLSSIVFVGSFKCPDLLNFLINPAHELQRTTQNLAVWFMASVFVFFAAFPFLAKIYGRGIFVWLLTSCFLFALWRSFGRPFVSIDSGGLYYQVSFRSWQLLLGMWCASWPAAAWKIKTKVFWITFGTLYLMLSAVMNRYEIGLINYSFPCYIISSLIFAFCMICLWHADLPAISESSKRIISVLSGMTYALFLFHMPVLCLVNRGLAYLGRFDFGLSFSISVILSCLLAYFLHMYIEIYLVRKVLKASEPQLAKFLK